MLTFPASTILGYPRIGPRRELKKALESYWRGESAWEDLDAVGHDLRVASWRRLDALGLGALPSNTFSFYDHVLDTAVLLGAVPERYHGPGAYFAMARGTADVAPLRMTKWFDTNYHYIVPEIDSSTEFRLDAAKPLREIQEARAIGLETRPVFLGPVSFLLLAQGDDLLARLPEVLDVYAELLAGLDTEWVQLDEPVLVADRTEEELAAVRTAYERLGAVTGRPGLFVASYFGDLGPALPVLADTPVEAVGIDLCRGPVPEKFPEDKTLVAGIVDGRSVRRADFGTALGVLDRLPSRNVVVSTSCSLLHVPYDLDLETDLAPDVRARLAFADQKVREVVDLASAFSGGNNSLITHSEGRGAPAGLEGSAGLTAGRRGAYGVRAAAQAEHLRLPPLPTTTIGSFPQTEAVRRARAQGSPDYEDLVKGEIERAIRLQERLGLDVLVHGEAERNDMVQYFAEHLDGFVTTRHGWVQSYGSRCTRPPILHGDVRRRKPITVEWTRYAQSLTDKPVKGMLTGPVTIAAWSFVRDDLPLAEVVWQIAEAVRQEVTDLEAAGTAVIQVDEPALRELLPLREEGREEYLEWAVGAYRHATSGAADHTQIHTHLCYSNASEVLAAIDALDADVTTIESARSKGRILGAVEGFERGLGPGVYDIHSPRIPSTEEIERAIAESPIPRDRLWVNPDCGLKTRTYEEVEAALANLVGAARAARMALREGPKVG